MLEAVPAALNNIVPRQHIESYMQLHVHVSAPGSQQYRMLSLLDTGNLAHTLISADDVPQELQPLVRRAPVYRTKLADSETDLELDKAIELTIVMPYCQNPQKTHEVTLKLYVAAKLTVPIIFGFRDLVNKAPTVFISYFMEAIRSTHTLDAVMQFITSTYTTSAITTPTVDQPSVKSTIQPKSDWSLPDLEPRFRLITLNVCGVHSALENGLEDFLDKHPHDILVLTELKLSDKKESAIRIKFMQRYRTVCIHTDHQTGILFASSFEDPVFTTSLPGMDPSLQQARTLMASFTTPPLVIVCQYGMFNNPAVAGRSELAAQFRRRLHDYMFDVHPQRSQRARHVMLVGDLQVAPTEADESPAIPESPGSTATERQDFHNLLDLGYYDAFRKLNPNTIAYTCTSTYPRWTNSDHPTACKRIDHILCSSKLLTEQCCVLETDASMTDHHAVAATIRVPPMIALEHNKPSTRLKSRHLTHSSNVADDESCDLERCNPAPDPNTAKTVTNPSSHTAQQSSHAVVSESRKHPTSSSHNVHHPLPNCDRFANTNPLKPSFATPTTPDPSLFPPEVGLGPYSEEEYSEEAVESLNTAAKQQLATVVALHILASVATPSSNTQCNSSPSKEQFKTDVTHCINVLFSERQKLVETVIKGQAEPAPEPQPTADEDKNFIPTDLPEQWRDAIKDTAPSERVKAYIGQIASQIHPRLLNDPDWKDFLLGAEAIKVWASKVTGMTGVDPLELTFDTLNMPSEHRAQCRKVPLQLVEIVMKHIGKYIDEGLFMRARRPAFTSPTVIAPKATEPFFRLAIDYRWINKFIQMIQAHVPVILEEINKAKGWSVFADIDWAQAFHQVPLHPDTSDKLSIITIKGPVSPKYMMEGVAPASSVLQNIVSELFEPVHETSICMFDNILTGASTDSELLVRVKQIVDICVKHNIVLNFKKSFIGWPTAKFFGYELFEGGYRIDRKRIESMQQIPFPSGGTRADLVKQMQSFLGFSVYFLHFVENYASAAAPLHDMTRDSFDWNPETWTRDYKQDFESFKAKLVTCMDIIYPDFKLEWILFVDASDVACGWILIQLRPTGTGGFITEPLAFGSEKLTERAQRWHINEKEAYAILRGLQTNHHLVAMKPLYVATDHFNLASDEHSSNVKITGYKQQWAQYQIKGLIPIDGNKNVADFPTRMYPKSVESTSPKKRNVLNFLAAAQTGTYSPNLKPSAKTFTFYVDDKPFFTGKLSNQQCMATSKAQTQCNNRTVIGAGLCWIHLLKEHNLAIRAATHGRGLFAVKAGNPNFDDQLIVFRNGDRILEYTGDELNNDELTERYGQSTAPYAMAKNKGLFIDAALLRGPASLANHSPKPNAKAGVSNRNTIVLTATRAIKHGQEILLNYDAGRRRGEPKYSFTDAQHKTTSALASPSNPQSSHSDVDIFPYLPPDDPKSETRTYTAAELEEAFKQAHTENGFCYGKTQTELRLRNLFPGASLSQRDIADRIMDCKHCLKFRWAPTSLKLQPRVKVITNSDPYSTVSIDGIPMPRDANGFSHIHITKNLGTHFIALSAHKAKEDANAVDAILHHMVVAGHIKTLISDKGSDYTARIVAAFNDAVGIQHRIAMTSRPQSTGIEPNVGRVKRMLEAISRDKHLSDRWSEPRVMNITSLMFNSEAKQPAGIKPSELTFGSANLTLQKLSHTVDPSTPMRDAAYFTALRNDLSAIRTAFQKTVSAQHTKRLAKNVTFVDQKLHPGDFVLYQDPLEEHTPLFVPKRKGPFVVVSTEGNAVTVHEFDRPQPTLQFPLEDVIPFNGTEQEARDLQMLDKSELRVLDIRAWRGNPEDVKTLMLLVHYSDNTLTWQHINKSSHTDVAQTQMFNDYCRATPALQFVALTQPELTKAKRALPDLNSLYTVSQSLYFNIRHVSHTLYQFKQYDLPNKYTTNYLMPATVVVVSKHKLTLDMTLLSSSISFTRMQALQYVIVTPAAADCVLTDGLLQQHPCVQNLNIPPNWDELDSAQTTHYLDDFLTPSQPPNPPVNNNI